MDISFLKSIDPMFTILFVFIIGAMIFIWKLNNDKTFSGMARDLIARNGKLSERKFTRLGAWVVSSWGLVYLIYIDRLDEWYFGLYLAAWVSNSLLTKMLEIKEKATLPASATISVSTSTATAGAPKIVAPNEHKFD